MDRRPRWDGDEQMTGVADGAPMRGALAEMSAAMSTPGWVNEDPEAHLGPKLTAWLDGDGECWSRVEMATDERWLVISAELTRADGRMRDLRADAFGHLIRLRPTGVNVERAAAGLR